MSRCFPYPPPGYALSSARKEALIESIKLQKVKVTTEEQRKKEKKREKKEKRKEKKEKKEKKHKNRDKSDVVQDHFGEKLWTDSKVEFLHKGSKAESEQLERSSLTEEHDKPVCLRLPSSSSDSTENSNKRKRNPSPVGVSRGSGKIIRIRLTSKKENQSDVSANEEQHCSTSGRTHLPSQTKDDIALRHRSEGCATELASSNIGRGLVLRTDREQTCSTSKPIETVASGKALISPVTDVVMTPMQKEELLYKNLIEKWVPPQLQNACPETEDQDWLFSGKKKVRLEKKRICRDEGMLCSSTSALWPRAQHLPEADVYALPYTVPF